MGEWGEKGEKGEFDIPFVVGERGAQGEFGPQGDNAPPGTGSNIPIPCI